LCENNRSDVMRKVMTEAVTHSVYSDRKWLQFMLIRKRDRICVHPIIYACFVV
jgi:hypothetical protein